jgi:hypothetical protein
MFIGVKRLSKRYDGETEYRGMDDVAKAVVGRRKISRSVV